MTQTSISVVIPTYQRCASVRRVLSALSHQTLASDTYEVIVVVDGSQDGTLEMVQQSLQQDTAQDPLPYTCQAIWQTNRGRAAACNTGIRAASGDLLVLLDDDMEPAPHFLAGHLHAHPQPVSEKWDTSQNRSILENGLGVLGAVPIRSTLTAPPIVQYIGAKFNAHLGKLAQPGCEIGFRDFYSGNFSILRSIICEVGLFDEKFTIYGNEDGELALRLMAAGVRLVYSPDALATQHYEKTFANLANDYLAIGKTAVLCAQKHPETFRALRLGAYSEESWKWRSVRASLLGLSRLFSGTPDQVIRFIAWLEQRQPPRLHVYYNLALDYFFWLGVRATLGRIPTPEVLGASSPQPSPYV